MAERPLPQISLDPEVLAAHESSPSVQFTSFTTDTAWSLGLAIRARILALPPSQRKPALISIALVGTGTQPHVVFQCATEPGTQPDNAAWVCRKRNIVLRWGVSSFLMRNKMMAFLGVGPADLEAAFAKKFAIDPASYVLSGGGFPIRVRGVEAPVAIASVSGLFMEHDHQVIVEAIEELVQQGEK